MKKRLFGMLGILFLVLPASVLARKPHAPPPPSGSTFSETFSTGTLNTSVWLVSSGNWPGNFNTMSPASISLSQGMLSIQLTQSSTGSQGGEIYTRQTYGYGTYEW